MRHFNQAPLPFVGQKRLFLNAFKQVLNEHISDDGEGWTIVDAFGGSGLLSHVAKRIKSKARVIYNDFDGYADRLKHISDTNRLRAELLQIVGDIVPKNKRLDNNKKQEIINKINDFKGFKDLNTIASWLLFSGQQVSSFEELFSKTFWNGIKLADYPSAEDYLDGLEIVSEPFQQLLPKFADNPKALFVLDSPYLCTKQNSYKMANYFDLIDFLQLIDRTRPPYVFFSSTKSEFVRFIAYMVQAKKDNWQAFDGAERIVLQTSLNYQVSYEDNLVLKF
ncbi:hypothetical protein [Avibacterium paragallinarum]|uniref:D12 class N6 adenine-specific DNA methyltransferase n=1 Tax=Avibacterium paragallinarum TaxID=728 RepID=A0A377I9W4_AVIPA|nr:hypothetical protein [Avibacterium paragallinarum]RZN74746.1 hypothetical protein EC523_11295 [Avibacterium paragallinarum]STO70190.1 D12 class N6 adenine-specific DNA methyltransferase [Avibacterium paragallinarum]STO70227.1 D12 class N6 adenine-specific DNA methyltransferase [Avibacterium paragallinarum]STO72076.1 D12 class N6 adenine-specific DNA methyltransferase [Avibacterium paragallinarum]